MRQQSNFLVGVTGFEPAKSLGPKPSAIPNFATPRWLFLYGRRCGQTCGQRRFFDGFWIFCDGRNRRRVNGSRRLRVGAAAKTVHAPKPFQDLFFVTVSSFSARSVPIKMLSGALISTVPAHSKLRYGQTCGQKQNRSRQAPQIRGQPPGAFVFSLLRRKDKS